MLGQRHVRRLHVAVDDPPPVGGRQGRGELARDAQSLHGSEGPTGEAVRERLALEQLHDEESVTLVLADVEESTDVWVEEARDGAGLAVEALALDGVRGELRAEDLDGHRAISRVSRPRYTSPMPPAPSGATTS